MSHIKRLGVGVLLLASVWLLGFLPVWASAVLVSMLTWGTGSAASPGLSWTAFAVVVAGLAYWFGVMWEDGAQPEGE